MSPDKQLRAYESFLKTVALDFSGSVWNGAVENGSFPSISEVWEPWQTPDELWTAFEARYQGEWPSLFGPKFLDATRTRVLRAWPSLVRDHHLYLKLKDHFLTVIRTRELDEEWGIDALVIVGPLAFGVHAWVDTARSRGYRAKKDARHANYHGACITVDLPLDMDSARRLGDTYVYSNKELTPLYQKIKEACVFYDVELPAVAA